MRTFSRSACIETSYGRILMSHKPELKRLLVQRVQQRRGVLPLGTSRNRPLKTSRRGDCVNVQRRGLQEHGAVLLLWGLGTCVAGCPARAVRFSQPAFSVGSRCLFWFVSCMLLLHWRGEGRRSAQGARMWRAGSCVVDARYRLERRHDGVCKISLG